MRKIAAILFVACCVSAAGGAHGAGPGLFGGLERGQWSVTSHDGGPSRTLCLSSPSQLVQLRHSGTTCRRYVVEETADRLTVQYTCKGNGYGRTSLRKETPTLVQIESQGIVRGRPFQFKAEARRTGACK